MHEIYLIIHAFAVILQQTSKYHFLEKIRPTLSQSNSYPLGQLILIYI